MRNEKIILITGANKGIGREAAAQLSRRGCAVYLTARNAKEGGEAAALIRARFIAMDVTDPASISAAAKAFAGSGEPHLDVLINNAGILLDEGESALSVSGEDVLKTFETNALGPLRVAQAFSKFLIKAPEPRIVNVSSSGGSLAHMSSWAPAYSISKAALNAVTRQLAATLSGKNVAVNAACPGWVRTQMGGPGAPRSVEQGAETIVWLALDAPQSFTGKFFGDGKREVAW